VRRRGRHDKVRRACVTWLPTRPWRSAQGCSGGLAGPLCTAVRCAQLECSCTRALLSLKFGRANPNSVAVRPFSGRFPPRHAPGVPGFGHMNRQDHALASPRCAYMSERGISGQPGCVNNFRLSFLLGIKWGHETKFLLIWSHLVSWPHLKLAPSTKSNAYGLTAKYCRWVLPSPP
jgi:hypothetical protein